MGVATSTATPVEQVDDLIRQVADEAGLDVAAQVIVQRCTDVYFAHLGEVRNNTSGTCSELSGLRTYGRPLAPYNVFEEIHFTK